MGFALRSGSFGAGGSTASHPPDIQDFNVPRRDFLGRMASRMGSMGYDVGEDDRRAALKQALMAMGARMLAGAGKEGVGAIAPAIGEGLGGYGAGLQQQHGLKREAAADAMEQERHNVYVEGAEAQATERKAETERRERETTEAKTAADREMDNRQRALGQIKDPEVRARIEVQVQDKDFWKTYNDATKPEEPKKREAFTLSPGQQRWEYDESGNLRSVASVPKEKSGGGEDDGMTVAQKRLYDAVQARAQRYYDQVQDRVNIRNRNVTGAVAAGAQRGSAKQGARPAEMAPGVWDNALKRAMQDFGLQPGQVPGLGAARPASGPAPRVAPPPTPETARSGAELDVDVVQQLRARLAAGESADAVAASMRAAGAPPAEIARYLAAARR